jgi:putative hemolysin
MGIGFLSVALLAACIVLSAFFSSLETAVMSLTVARLKKLMEDRPSQAMALELWLKKPNFVLTTILVGNNIVNTLAAATATVLAQSIFESYAISAATFFITIMLLIFGEVTPKTLGRHNAEKIAPMGMTLLLPLYVLLLPITWALSFLAGRLVTMFGGSSSSLTPVTTKEDIAYMIRLGNEEGVFERADGHLLQSVIEFRETVAKESMVPRTEIGSFEVDASYQEVLERVIKEGHTRWPVYENNIDNIIGIFHAKDLLRNLDGKGFENFSLRELLRPAKFVPDMMKITSLLKEFQASRVHLAVVVDEYGGTAGIISLEDVLEEIVGEIRDEYDDEELERTVHQIDPNNYMVNGRAKIFELGKLLGVSFPESDAFDSLGGFLVGLHGFMPKIGSKITFGDCVFTIKAADEKKIMLVHIHHARRGSLLNQQPKSNAEELAAA